MALTYDSGDYFKTLDMVVKAADYAGFEQRRQELATRGKLRGIGIATYIEACAMAPSVLAGQLGARAGLHQFAEVRVHPTGSITVFDLARTAMARATRRPSPSWCWTAWALLSTRSTLSTATPARSRSAWGPMPRAR